MSRPEVLRSTGFYVYLRHRYTTRITVQPRMCPCGSVHRVEDDEDAVTVDGTFIAVHVVRHSATPRPIPGNITVRELQHCDSAGR